MSKQFDLSKKLLKQISEVTGDFSDSEDAYRTNQSELENYVPESFKDLKPAMFSSVEYWNEHYSASPECKERYGKWGHFEPIIKRYIGSYKRVLYIGCGTSKLGVELLSEGARTVVNIDSSAKAIDLMKDRHGESKSLKWIEMNAINIEFNDRVFDLVIEKGTIDCMMTATSGLDTIPRMMSNVFRVLKSGGVFVSISRGSPQARDDLFGISEDGFEVVAQDKCVHPLITSRSLYVHVLRKK